MESWYLINRTGETLKESLERKESMKSRELSTRAKWSHERRKSAGHGVSEKLCRLGVAIGEIVLFFFRNSFLMGAKTEKINKFQD